MKKVELLAPAGSMDSLYAAVGAGADAVYLGGSKFSARAYASNFDEKNMKDAVEYCHLYGVKIYVTLNILMKENEINEVIKYVEFLYKTGVDALIVQDAGLIYLLKGYFPDFEIHASTQMTVHNGEGAKFLNDIGAKRVVLSRELSLDEIKHISKDLGIETEIFIHGAMCVCYSGQCLMSSIIGGRSGNRGRCAQPCRLPYTLIDAEDDKIRHGYLLSPKDICTLDCLEDIINTGAASLKIEGRMKRPEYVAGVVDIYRKAIDSIYENGKLNKEYVENGKNILMQLFNREGFSKAYLYKNTGKDMMAYNFPANTGIRIGKADKNNFINIEQNLRVNDGVRNAHNGFTVSKIIKNNKEVCNAFKGDIVKIFPNNYKNNDVLYKTNDADLLSKYSVYYKNKFYRRINIPLNVNFKIEEPIKLTTIYDNIKVISKGEEVQKALKSPIKKEKLESLLHKTKDIPFDFKNITYQNFEEGFMAVSSINDVRRKLINDLHEHIIKQYKCKENKKEENKIKFHSTMNNDIPNALICINSMEQFSACIEAGYKDIAVNIFNKNNDIDLSQIIDKNIYLKVPNIIKKEFNDVCKIIDDNISNIKGIVTANLGIINKYKYKTMIIGDYKLNILNSSALNFYKDYIDMPCLSVELNKREIREMIKNNDTNVQILLYGRIELMVSEYCVIGSVLGDKNCLNKCSAPCTNKKYYIKDRMNSQFLVTTDKFCRSHIYNSVSTNLIPNIDTINELGINFYRLDFIDENYDETFKVLKAFKEKRWDFSYTGYTRGHFKRGVE